MYSLAKSSIALLMGLLLAASANANLIVNGSFEDNDVAEGTWQYFVADDVNGWDGSNIEIWDGLNGVASADGEQHAGADKADDQIGDCDPVELRDLERVPVNDADR